MIREALACVVVLFGTPNERAPSEPSSADIYVEVPNVQALLEACRAAPLVRFLQDEEVQRIGALADTLGMAPKEWSQFFSSALTKPVPGQSASLCTEVESLSLSITGLNAKDQVGMGLRERLGAMAIVDFLSIEAAARAEKSWASLQGRASSFTQAAATVRIEERELAVVQHHFGAPMSIDAWSLRDGKSFVIGAGRRAPSEYAEFRARRARVVDARGLEADEDETFSPSAGVTVFRASTNIERVPEFETSGSESSARWLSSLSVLFPILGSRGQWRMQLRGDRFVTEGSYEQIGDARALDTAYGLHAVDAQSVKMVAKEAIGAWLVHIEALQLATCVRQLVPMKAAEDASGTITDASKTDGIDSMSAALGGASAVYLLPIANIQSLLPRVVVAIELKDKVAFRRGLDAFAARLAELDPKLQVRDRPYHDVPLLTFSRADEPTTAEKTASNEAGILVGTFESTLRPSIALLDDRILIGLAPSHLQSEIRRLEAKTIEPHAIAAEGRFPIDAIEASTMDWAGAIGRVYDVTRGLAPLLAQGKLPFDASKLLPASSFTRFFQASWSWSRRVEGHIYRRSESSFGPETPLALLALGFEIMRSMNATKGASATAEAPALAYTSDANDIDASASTLATLRDVKTGLAIYRSQLRRHPPQLEALLESTASFPKGFLDTQQLPTDAWNHALVYEVEADGSRFRLRSCGSDGIDQHGSGDDIVAP